MQGFRGRKGWGKGYILNHKGTLAFRQGVVGKCCKDRLSTSKDTKSGLKTYVTVPHFNSYAFLVVSDVSV